MSEFKYACPVCGQHIQCDSSQAGTQMECPTCFQKITVPQAPATEEQKFILTGTKEKKYFMPAGASDVVAMKKKSPVAAIVIVIAILAAGTGFFFFGGKLLRLVSGPHWQASDIGDAGANGTFSRANDIFTINGSGADTWGRSDSFYYVFQSLKGDGSLAARVLNLKNTHLWAKTGVMIRETTNADSMFALATIRPDGQMQFIWRNATGGEAATSQLVGGMGFPKWVKITRTGDSFSAYYKANAEDAWQQVGTPQTINMSAAQIGLIVCAHHAGTLCEAQFDQIALEADNKAGQQ